MLLTLVIKNIEVQSTKVSQCFPNLMWLEVKMTT